MGKARNLVFLQQQPVPGTRGRDVVPDGVLRYSIRVEFGLWEAKRSDKDIDAEIAEKKTRGYPLRNIIFENARTAVLYQHGEEARRADMEDVAELEGLVAQFFAYERKEVRDFNAAVAAFQRDPPEVLAELRERIDRAYEAKPAFRAAAGLPSKPILRSDRETGAVRLDSETTLEGLSGECWDYRLGNRCGIDWVLDQHKEKVADLLPRVARVSVETMEVVAAMREERERRG